MNSDKTYHRYCAQCDGETPHVSPYSRSIRIALRTWQIAVFFLSFAMLYPHTFTTDDEFTAQCTKCGQKVQIPYG